MPRVNLDNKKLKLIGRPVSVKYESDGKYYEHLFRNPNKLGLYGTRGMVIAYGRGIALTRGGQIIDNPCPKKNPARGDLDPHAARELYLFISSDPDLQRSQGESIRVNLLRKMAAGKYDHSRAPQLWYYLAESGAKKYSKEHSTGTDWNEMFSVPTRKAAAKEMADYFYEEVKLGNYDGTNIAREGAKPKPFTFKNPCPGKKMNLKNPGISEIDFLAIDLYAKRTTKGNPRKLTILYNPDGTIVQISKRSYTGFWQSVPPGTKMLTYGPFEITGRQYRQTVAAAKHSKILNELS